MFKKKRGQVDIFIIVIIIIAIILLLFLLKPWEKDITGIKDKDAAINNYISSELRNAADSAVIEAGKHGGVIYKDNISQLYAADYNSAQDWSTYYLIQYPIFPDLGGIFSSTCSSAQLPSSYPCNDFYYSEDPDAIYSSKK